MKIWIVSVGLYEDARIVGVATSEDWAAQLLAFARDDLRYGDLYREGYHVDGPYESNTVMPG